MIKLIISSHSHFGNLFVCLMFFFCIGLLSSMSQQFKFPFWIQFEVVMSLN